MVISIPLVGGGGEPVDLRRTFLSHGVADLPPMRAPEDGSFFEVTLPLPGSRPRTVRIDQARRATASIHVEGRPISPQASEKLARQVRHVLRLDEDLSGFYAACAAEPELSWACAGAGRMMRNPTVFEEVVKTICTTNCTWSATVRMVGALVAHLGEPSPTAPSEGPWGRTFPSPEAMATADDRFYTEVVRAGYRGPYLRSLARSVATGEIDLESLTGASTDISDEEVERRLLSLPGVGPYAAAHIMMMLGRYSHLILDSWTRPKYARLTGKRAVKDSTIQRRFRRYGRYAGLAFWLFLTRDWVEDGTPIV